MRPKVPELVEALTGNFGEHHAFLCRLRLDRIDQLRAAIDTLSVRIEKEMRPFARQLELLKTIPGIGRATAEVIIAETGADMARFRTPATSRPGRVSVPATTSPQASASPGVDATATGGSRVPWAPRPWQPPAPASGPTSAPDTCA